MNPNDVSAFAKSHRFVVLLTALGFLIIALAIFQAGVAVGFHKAAFAGRWEESYQRDFGDPRSAFGGPALGIPNPHGAFGTIESVALPTLVIVGGAEAEKAVRVSSTTLIRWKDRTAAPEDLMVGLPVIVIGEPGDDGAVQARLIRVMDPRR